MASVKGIPSELKFYLASSTGKHFEFEAKEIYLETDDGDLGVLPGHQPEFYSIGAGYVRCKKANGEEFEKIVFNGFVQIEPDVVRIGAEEVYQPENVDVEKVKEEIEAIKEELSSLTEEEEERRKLLEKEIKMREDLVRKAR